MKRGRFSEEQIIGILKEHSAGLSRDGVTGMLALASDSKKPAAMSRDGLGQIKLVAGARKQREFTLAVEV